MILSHNINKNKSLVKNGSVVSWEIKIW